MFFFAKKLKKNKAHQLDIFRFKIVRLSFHTQWCSSFRMYMNAYGMYGYSVYSCVFEDSKLSFHKYGVVFYKKNLSINPTSKNQAYSCVCVLKSIAFCD